MFNSRVYYVSSPEDPTALIALNIEINGDTISWFDTIKERIMRIEKIIDNNPEHFVFQRQMEGGGGEYAFVPMSLEIYRNKVKNRTLIPHDFPDEEAMFRSFEETINNAW